VFSKSEFITHCFTLGSNGNVPLALEQGELLFIYSKNGTY
jgi:hypothetical protein